MPAFSSRRMAQMESSITDIVETMLDDIERQGPAFDAMAQYGAKLVVGALVTTMMGLSEERRQILLDYQDMLPLATAIKPGRPYPPECQLATRRAADLAHDVIAVSESGVSGAVETFRPIKSTSVVADSAIRGFLRNEGAGGVKRSSAR
jgi:cytochrome P450